MKVDRRSFLSFLIGGAAGTALSPLPWKLTDDLSIWTQMWPWTPVPPKGEVTYEKSACTLCPGGCGISVRKVGERVVKIEGMPGHPVNDGGICILGLTGPQLLYGPRRVTSPIKKIDGKFRPVSWNTALDEIAGRLKEVRSAGQSHKVACIAGSDRGTVPELIKRFLTVYGSANFIRMPSIADTYELTLALMQGVDASPGFDLENTDYVISFGSGVLDGWGSPVYWFRAHSRWQAQEAKLVQIEPRLSNTAAKFGNWVPIEPGTEGVLALGLAHVIIKESLYRPDFVDTYTTGFDSFRRAVLDGYSPGIVSKATGVEPAKIASLAREFARARRPLAICGRGRGSTPGSIREFMAIHALNALVGNINQTGGLWAVPTAGYSDWPEPQLDAVAASGNQKPRIDGAGSSRFPQARYLASQWTERTGAEENAEIEVLMTAGANPLYSLPNSRAVQQAFAQIPLKISFSSYMDETARQSDYILPNHVYLERYEDIPSAAGFPQPLVGLCQPVLSPQHNTRHTGDVFITLAKQMGGSIEASFPWENYETCLKESLTDIWDTLRQEGYWVDSDYTPPAWTESFETNSAKFEFITASTGALTRFAPVEAQGDETTYPLLLIPYDSMRLATGYVAEPPFMTKAVPDTVLKGQDVFVEVNPQTATKLGLQNGSLAILTTPVGEARVRIHLFEGIMPGLVALPRGLGHQASGPFIAGKGVNVNQLIGPVTDSASGFDAAWGVRAKLVRA